MPHRLQDQVAIVTGGGAGIGQGIAKTLAGAGAKVAIWDLDTAASKETVHKIETLGGRAVAFQADVTKAESIADAVNQTVSELGEPQILVNNAGFSRDRSFLEMSQEDWDSVLNVCLTSVFLVSQAVVARMIPSSYGRIINIASRASLGERKKANYSAAKAGVLGLTRAMSIELAPQGITVNAVSPGLIRTDRVMNMPTYADIDRRAKEHTPIKRPGEVSDIADCVLFLASPETGFISGEDIRVTGGRYSSV